MCGLASKSPPRLPLARLVTDIDGLVNPQTFDSNVRAPVIATTGASCKPIRAAVASSPVYRASGKLYLTCEQLYARNIVERVTALFPCPHGQTLRVTPW